MAPPVDGTIRAAEIDALVDASSAILLAKVGLMEACCKALALSMTRSVYEEVAVGDRPAAADLRALAGRRPGFTVLADPGRQMGAPAAADMARLHRGERDTLTHYLGGAGRFVIIDDGKGVRTCRRLGIPHVNALLCPQLLFHCGHIPEGHCVQTLMDRLVDLGRYSASVVRWARACRPPDVDFFTIGRVR